MSEAEVECLMRMLDFLWSDGKNGHYNRRYQEWVISTAAEVLADAQIADRSRVARMLGVAAVKAAAILTLRNSAYSHN